MIAALFFVNVEKTIGKKQEKIRERQQSNAVASGEEWIAPEVRAAEDEKIFMESLETETLRLLKLKCEKKNLSFEAEQQKYFDNKQKKSDKAAAKKQRAEAKAAKKANLKQQRQEARIAAMTTEKRTLAEQKRQKLAEKDEAAWLREEQAGEAHYKKAQAELKALTAVKVE
jgi:hypothetical protein